MHLDIITIGNSQGIRLPKALLAQCGFSERVEVTIENNRMVLSKSEPKKKGNPHEGWAEAILKAKASNEEDSDALPYFANDWDEMEWEW